MKKISTAICFALFGLSLIGCNPQLEVRVEVCGDTHDTIPIEKITLTSELDERFTIDQKMIQEHGSQEFISGIVTFWSIGDDEFFELEEGETYQVEVTPLDDSWSITSDTEVEMKNMDGSETDNKIYVKLIQEGYDEEECEKAFEQKWKEEKDNE